MVLYTHEHIWFIGSLRQTLNPCMLRDDRVLSAEYEIIVDKGVKLNNNSVNEMALRPPCTLSFTVNC